MILDWAPLRRPRLDDSTTCLAPFWDSHCAKANPNLQQNI